MKNKRIFLPKFIQNFLRKVIPVYYEDLGPNFNGRTTGLYIVIHKGRSKESQLITLEHEWCHVFQSAQLLWIFHVLLKAVSKKYEIYTEASAYAVSIEAGRSKRDAVKAFARTEGISEEKAQKEIEKYLIEDK